MDGFGGTLQGHMWYVVLVIFPQLNVSIGKLSPKIVMHQLGHASGW